MFKGVRIIEISIVLPTYNERTNIVALIQAILEALEGLP